MKPIQTDDVCLKAEIYTELINNMQAKIYEFGRENPGCINVEIRTINNRLSDARMESRIKVDDEHFEKWERLLITADAAMIRSKLFG